MDFRDNEAELKSLVGEILDEAKKQGADQAEVSVSLDTGLSVNVRKGELENLEFNQDKGFGITVYYGSRKGSASTTDSSQEAIAETVKAASQIASNTEEDECNGLAAAELMPSELPDLELFHPWAIEPDAAVDIAVECEDAGLRVDPRLTNSDGAQVSTQQAMRVYGNSHGFIGANLGTRHGMSCVLIGEDENGMQRDYWFTTSRLPDELETAAAVGKKAGERTVARLSAHKTPTGNYPVLFSAPLAGSVFGHLMGAISGGALYRKASFLVDSLNTQVLPEWLSLVERPRLPRNLNSANFDSDGVGTWEKAFVEAGTVKSYVLSSYSARRLGMESSGNAGGIHNLDIEGPQQSVEDLIAELGTGLIVEELMGQGVNMVTGDYSRGAAGFWVEDGKIQFPVEEVTIAGNLRDMFKNIVALGDDVDYRSGIRSPSLMISEMTIAGE